jgi:DNA-binding NarL/FixJ family response regulator
MNDAEITIVVVDDHPLLRRGLRATIESEADLRLVGEAADGRTALDLIRAAKPMIAIVDIGLPDRSGIEVARVLDAEGHDVRVIVLTREHEPEFFENALAVGAKGYVVKTSIESDLVNAIRAVAAGAHYTSPVMTSYLVRRRTSGSDGVEKLTQTERRVLRLIGELMTSKEIAEEMNISVRTVEKHRANISSKLCLHGSFELAKFARSHMSEL